MKKINIKEIETMYSIFEDGRILNIKNGRELKGSITGNGYVRVTIFGERYLKHRIIAKKFLPKVKKKKYINHINGDKLCNNKSNLEWCTMSENVQHAFNTGLKTATISPRFGESNSSSILTDSQVLAIRQEVGISAFEIAKKYGVSKSTIKHILKNRTWTHLLSKDAEPIVLVNSRIKMSLQLAREIRLRVSRGELQSDLAIIFKVNKSVISKIVTHTTWKEKD